MATVAYPDQPAFPVDASKAGMTIRHYIAAVALQGLLAKPLQAGAKQLTPELTAKEAVKFADALIEELGKEQE